MNSKFGPSRRVPRLTALLCTGVIWSAAAAEKDDPHERGCRANLELLAEALGRYMVYHEGKLPTRISELYHEGLVPDLNAFTCPASGKRITDPRQIDAATDYAMIRELTSARPLQMFRDQTANHDGKALAYFSDRTVQQVAAPAPAAVVTAAEKTTAPPTVIEPGPKQATAMKAIAQGTTEPTTGTLPPPAQVRSDPRKQTAETKSGASMAAEKLAAADAAWKTHRLDEAKPLYSAAARSDPQSTDAFLGLGRCCNLLGDLEGGVQAYEALLRLAPATPNVRSWLAELAVAQGDHAKAQRWLDEELKAQPSSTWALSWVGSVQWEAGRVPVAQQTFARVAAIDPKSAEHRFNNGTLLLTWKQPRRALTEFTAALAINPASVGAYYYIAECYVQLGRGDLAMPFYERYLQHDRASEWAARARKQLESLKSAAK